MILESVASRKSLRVHDDGKIDGAGGSGPLGNGTPAHTVDGILHWHCVYALYCCDLY